jgi:hypothetical protein
VGDVFPNPEHLVMTAIEGPLTLEQMFRLVEIAATTGDFEIRKAALLVLDRAINPLYVVAADPAFKSEKAA